MTELELLQHVLDEYITGRRAALVRSFIEALTVGGPGGAPRPIEMHAHEPTRCLETSDADSNTDDYDPRYVGDMLAWIHQSCPGETESIHHLLHHVDKVDRRALETRIMTGATEGVSVDYYGVIMILYPYPGMPTSQEQGGADPGQ